MFRNAQAEAVSMDKQGYICELAEVGREAVARVGGKGANLGEMVRAGFEVPGGFCVSTDAYREHLLRNGLEDRIQQVLRELNHEVVEEVEQASSAIRALIEKGRMPAAVAADIVGAYRKLGPNPAAPLLVAVRSSATTEDLPGASFAGQQETYLDIRGDEEVLDAVRRCWSSLWTARAIAYRQVLGFDHLQSSLAVVIQEMCAAEVAGVLFTANPVTSDLNEIVINASWGLGEAVVSGWVNPDQYVLGKSDLHVRQNHVAEKLIMVVRNESGPGAIKKEVPKARREQPCLSEAEMRTLGELGKRIEKHYGFPQDVEWARRDGRFYVLQSREITSLEGIYDAELERWNRQNPDLDKQIVWTRAFSDEFMTRPATPFFYTLHADHLMQTWDYMNRAYGFRRLLGLRMFRYHKTRPFESTTYAAESLRYVPKGLRSDQLLNYFPLKEREQMKQFPFSLLGRLWGELRVRVLHREQGFGKWIKNYYRGVEDLNRRMAEIEAVDLTKLSDREVWNYFYRSEELSLENSYLVVIGLISHGTTAILVTQAILARCCGAESDTAFAELVSGLEGSKTVEENSRLWELARIVSRSPQLKPLFLAGAGPDLLAKLDATEAGRTFLVAFRKFIQEFGHRGAADREISYLRWGDAPELCLPIIRSLVLAGDEVNPQAVERKLYQRRMERTERVMQQVRSQRWGWALVRLLRFVLRYTQETMVVRDNLRFFWDRFRHGCRRTVLEVGERFARRGLLARPEDIFFLGKEEVGDIIDGKLGELDIRRRVRVRERVFLRQSKTSPPKFFQAAEEFDDVEPGVDASLAGASLAGIAASPGKVTGVARVVRDLSEIGKVQKGDILVANSTDPGWTPVFMILGGVIVETAGILAHATLISREYGIPCVTAVHNATDVITDGELVTVDGDKGIVIRQSASDSAPRLAG